MVVARFANGFGHCCAFMLRNVRILGARFLNARPFEIGFVSWRNNNKPWMIAVVRK